MQNKGFTLLEILIALFIFTIVSMIMMTNLHSVMNAQEVTEKNAKQLRQLQIALLILSRDIEQAVNRPVLNAAGKEEDAFIGSSRDLTFTHTGLANPTGAYTRSTLQRVQYLWQEDGLWRAASPVLDAASQTVAQARPLLPDVTELRFQYLDKEGKFHDSWPLDSDPNQPLPRAVRIILTLSHWGKMSQLYVISE